MSANVYRLDDFNRSKRPNPLNPNPLAPWPAIDRTPNILGSGLTLSYISSVMRLCLTGYRQQYVDLLEELLTLDPHAFSVLQKRILAIGQGKLEFVAPDEKSIPDDNEREIAADVAAWVQSEVNQIPDLTGAMTQLAWALYYAVSCCEKILVRRDDGCIGIESLEFVHYRRLSYPDPWKWDLYVWDQGLVMGPNYGLAPTQGVYGLNIESIREKFIVHAPQVCGSYPTRDGLGRELAYWMAIKHIASRLAPQYLERFAIPFADVEYRTAESDELPDQPRIATKEDIALGSQAARNVGTGALGYWTHPDSLKLTFGKPEGSPTLTFAEWITLCNSEMSKAASGGTLTTEVTSTGGNRAVAAEQGKREDKLYQYDANRMAATWKRDISDFLVANNPKYAGLPKRLYPLCKVHVNDDPDPSEVIARAAQGAAAGIPIDADAIAKQANLPTVPKPDGQEAEPRRMIPIQPVSISVPNEVLGLPKMPDPPPPPTGAPLTPAMPPVDAAKKPAPKEKK